MDLVCPDRRLLVLSQNGYGKLTKVENFPTHKRGGMGIKAAVVNSKTGQLVTVRAIDAGASEVIIISTQGQTIRLSLESIPELGRATQGVRIMRLNDADTVASFGIVDDAGVSDDKGPEEPQEER
jgi:DNA gyrase subunit A